MYHSGGEDSGSELEVQADSEGEDRCKGKSNVQFKETKFNEFVEDTGNLYEPYSIYDLR